MESLELKDKVNILGTEYSIKRQKEKETSKLEHSDGICEFYLKEIVIDDFEPTSETVANPNLYKKKVLRHEIVHAFLYESGLDVNSEWARNEEIVDWIALQAPKLQKAFEEAGCL